MDADKDRKTTAPASTIRDLTPAAAAAAAADTISRLRRMLLKINAEKKAEKQLQRTQEKRKPDEKREKGTATAPIRSNHGCHPDRPGCQPVIVHLPDELFDDPSSGDEDGEDDDDEEEEEEDDDGGEEGDNDDDESEEDREQRRALRRLLPQPLKRNGHLTLKIDDAALRDLLQSIASRFEPGQPDMLDRVIAMFNSGRCLGPEFEAQMRRLRAQQRRLQRRRQRRALDPNWTPGRRLMSMAECFRSLGRILGGGSGEDGGSAGIGGGNGLALDDIASAAALPDSLSPPPTPSLPSQPPLDTVDYPDEGLAIASPSPTMSPSPPSSPSPPPPHSTAHQSSGELRLEITEATLAQLGSLKPETECHLRGVLLSSLLPSPTTNYCLAEPEPPLELRWLRRCARQSSYRREWDRRLADCIGDMLQRRLSGALYEPVWCSRLTNLLASDLLELVMHELGNEFKVVGLLSIGSVTEIDRMAIVTRSAHSEGLDTCRAFHYQNESVFAIFTCHLFQQCDRLLISEAPLDIDNAGATSTASAAAAAARLAEEEAEDSGLRQCEDVALI